MVKIGVSLLSGGLDSTTVTAYARNEGYEVLALTFDYGQKHARELDAARDVARHLGSNHEIVALPALGKLSWFSSLTDQARAVPRGRSPAGMAGEIPSTYVPMRNSVFIVLAAALLESRVLSLIEESGAVPGDIRASIFVAANSVDYSGYPDCRPGYFAAMRQAIIEGSKLGKQYGVPLDIVTPVLHLTKAEIVRLGLSLHAPLELTWSCYEGGQGPCGSCDSCILRARGFADAGVADPMLERLAREKGIAEG